MGRRGPRTSSGRAGRARKRGGARERGKSELREERGGGDREARARVHSAGWGRGPRRGLRGAASGRAGPYRAAAAGRHGAPTPAWPPEPGVPRPRRPSPAMPPRAARPALQVARLRMRVTDRKFPRTGAKWKGGGSLSPPAGAEAGAERLGRAGEPVPGAALRPSPRARRGPQPALRGARSSPTVTGEIGRRSAGEVVGAALRWLGRGRGKGSALLSSPPPPGVPEPSRMDPGAWGQQRARNRPPRARGSLRPRDGS